MTPLREPLIDQASVLFRALGDASRLRILKALLDAKGPLNQGAVAKAAVLSQANASKHLSCLVREGLVTRSQEGNTANFEVVNPIVGTLCGLVCDHVSGRIHATFKALE